MKKRTKRKHVTSFKTNKYGRKQEEFLGQLNQSLVYVEDTLRQTFDEIQNHLNILVSVGGDIWIETSEASENPNHAIPIASELDVRAQWLARNLKTIQEVALGSATYFAEEPSMFNDVISELFKSESENEEIEE